MWSDNRTNDVYVCWPPKRLLCRNRTSVSMSLAFGSLFLNVSYTVQTRRSWQMHFQYLLLRRRDISTPHLDCRRPSQSGYWSLKRGKRRACFRITLFNVMRIFFHLWRRISDLIECPYFNLRRVLQLYLHAFSHVESTHSEILLS